jgi:hypothetical protein
MYAVIAMKSVLVVLRRKRKRKSKMGKVEGMLDS